MTEQQKPDVPESAGNGAEIDQGMAEIEALTAQLGAAEHAAAELRDSMLRERAEIENQRRRMQRELEQARRFANERLLADLLPVCDGLEHGLAADTDNADALREGMQLTLRALLKVGEGNGLRAIDPLGQPFDPELHQAMSVVPSESHAPDTVVAVMQKGYVLNDRLLRPALVTVSRASQG
jgi:molecular chaperone GrpE